LGAAIMFGLYNLAGFDWISVTMTVTNSAGVQKIHTLADVGYWISSTIAYFAASVFSFFMNKNFTFGYKSGLGLPAIKFIINIAVCYLLAFSLAKPLIISLVGGMNLSQNAMDNIAMLAGMTMFTGFNYIGQRYFVFRKSAV